MDKYNHYYEAEFVDSTILEMHSSGSPFFSSNNITFTLTDFSFLSFTLLTSFFKTFDFCLLLKRDVSFASLWLQSCKWKLQKCISECTHSLGQIREQFNQWFVSSVHNQRVILMALCVYRNGHLCDLTFHSKSSAWQSKAQLSINVCLQRLIVCCFGGDM